MNIPDEMLPEINKSLEAFLKETLQGKLLNHPELELLKVVYRNGAIDMFKILNDRGLAMKITNFPFDKIEFADN